MSHVLLRYLREQGVAGFKALPLCEIDDDVLCQIMSRIPARFLLDKVARVNRALKRIVDSDTLWESQLASYRWALEPPIERAWRAALGSHKLVFRLAIQVGWLDGTWVLNTRPRGGLLRMAVGADAITADILVPDMEGEHPMAVKSVQKFQSHTPFRFEVRPDAEVRVDGVPARHFFGFSGSNAAETEARVIGFTRGSTSMHYKLASRGKGHYSYLFHELSAAAAHRARSANTNTPRSVYPPAYARPGDAHAHACREHPPRSALVQAVPRQLSSDEFNPESLQGLWRGAYGPHGIEFMTISLANLISDRFTELVGLKVTGDPNVPCGELAFRAPLNRDDASATRRQNTPQTYHCSCSFACDCPKSAKEGGVLVRALYDMLALAAEHDFVNPSWNTGFVAALPDESGDVLLVWKGLFSIRFSRVRPGDLPVPQALGWLPGCAMPGGAAHLLLAAPAVGMDIDS
ncbi:hypothetical protein T484DRAFT_1957782 [Baffinella frigidus]|nr:hypothetical protein T484DRAFT_1957782 [Cryptophyta sp. CCMP2293]